MPKIILIIFYMFSFASGFSRFQAMYLKFAENVGTDSRMKGDILGAQQ